MRVINSFKLTSISPIPPEAFVMTIDTTKGGSASDTFVLPLRNFGTNNFEIGWGDSTTSAITAWNDADLTHVYSSNGVYQIIITSLTNEVGNIFFNFGGDRLKVLSIDQWGSIAFQSFSTMFGGCSNMVSNYSDSPNLSGATDCSNLFRNCTLFNGDVDWDMSTIVSIDGMFQSCTAFNDAGVENWITTALVNLSNCFFGCTSFNRNIGGWDVSGVSNFTNFLRGCSVFDNGGSGLIGSWDVSSMTNATGIFNGCSVFNQTLNWNVSNLQTSTQMFQTCFAFTGGGLSGWDVGSLQLANSMFQQCTVLDFNSSTWDVSSLTNGNSMFYLATSFAGLGTELWNVVNLSNAVWMFRNTVLNRDYGGWNIQSLTDATNMFFGVTLSTVNYDSLLIGWESNAHNNGVTFHGGNSKYTGGGAAEAARTVLGVTDSWTITDGGVA